MDRRIVLVFVFAGLVVLSLTALAASPPTKPMYTDAEFFAQLELSFGGLEAVRAAVEREDWAVAKGEYGKFVSTFQRPVPPGWEPRPVPKQPSPADKTADDFCDGTILLPNGETVKRSADPGWVKDLARWVRPEALLEGKNRRITTMEFLNAPIGAYKRTGEEKYARAVMDFLRDWIAWARPPAPDSYPEYLGPFTPNWLNNAGPPFWRWILGIRGRLYWLLHFYNALRTSPSMTTDDHITMLKVLLEHVQLLHAFHQEKSLKNATALPVVQRAACAADLQMLHFTLAFAAAFREFKSSEDIIDSYRRNFDLIGEAVIHPDGSAKYGSTAYHADIVNRYKSVLEMAEFLSVGPSARQKAFARETDRAYMYLCQPNGHLPALGDAAVGLHSIRERGLDQLLQEFKPEQASTAFPLTGWYVMRSGWNADALYAVFRAGPHGMAHGHQDHLSFIVYAYDKNMIVDPGSPDAFPLQAGHYRGQSRHHNTITVDGQTQVRLPAISFESLKNPWETTNRFDFVADRHTEGYGVPDKEEYAGSNQPVLTGPVHDRHVFFLKDEYWIVSDLVTGTGRHQVTSNLHFGSEDIEVDEQGGVIQTKDPNGANLVAAIRATNPLTFHKYFGEDTPPYRGWMIIAAASQSISRIGTKQRAMRREDSRGRDNAVVPIPALEISQEGLLPLAFDMLLYPYPEGKPAPQLKFTKYAPNRPPQCRGLHIAQQDRQLDDHFLTTFEETDEAQIGDFRLRGRAAHVRKDAHGRLVHILLVSGTALLEGGKTLLKCQPQQTSLCISYQNSSVVVEAPELRQLKVYAPAAAKAIVNEQAVPAKRVGDYLEINVTNARR